MSGTLKIAGTTLATNPSNSKVEIDDAVSGKGICKAWVNFNGRSTTNSVGPCTIRDQYNVSSCNWDADGKFTINFTNDLNDENYSFAGTAMRNAAGHSQGLAVYPLNSTTYTDAYNKSYLKIYIQREPNATYDDPLSANIIVFGS